MLRRIAVVASTAEVASPNEQAAAYHVGRLLGENALALVYDGSPVGVIATVADAAAQYGGRLIGVTIGEEQPVHDALTERRTVTSAEQWRTAVVELVDAWLGLPGGFGSLDDAFAVWGWPGARQGEQPLGLLDSGGYYSGLLRNASDQSVDRFVLESQRGRLIMATDAADLLRRLRDYRPPETRRDAPYED